MIACIIAAMEDPGDRAFMENLYTGNYALMYRKALSITKNHHEAEDVVEATMIKMIDRIPLLRTCGRISLRAYLLRSVRNTAIDRLHRLVCFDPVSGQFSVMKQQEGTWLTDIDLFGGPDGRLFIAAADSEKKISQIGEISPDGGVSAIAHIPRQGGEYARAFAVDRDAVYYLLNGAIYEALGFDFENARAVAATSVNGGHGVALGGGSYAVINEEQARIFHFEMADTAIGELVVDFRTSDDRVNARFIETHENIALVKDDAWIRYDGDRRAMIDAGELNADIWILDADEARMFMEAGIYAPIEDEELLEDTARLMPGVREFVTVDGQIAAYPIRGYAYCDFAFSPEILERLGMDTSDIPETWEEMLDILDMLSRRPDVDSFCASDTEWHFFCRDRRPRRSAAARCGYQLLPLNHIRHCANDLRNAGVSAKPQMPELEILASALGKVACSAVPKAPLV